MTRGIRFIDGREYLLAGRFNTRSGAQDAARLFRQKWGITRVLKTPHRFGDYSVWVHAAL
jgi:hypothetical protein